MMGREAEDIFPFCEYCPGLSWMCKL
uniref:Uncharacterized protein n=1 Tax=Arundo donax TaxID=35708 RepID=A0A0A8ZCY3_ARUDO